MKKYLMTAMAAVAMGVAFTSCSHNTDLYGGEEGGGKINGRTVQEQIELDKAVYNAAFEQSFGKVAPTVDWGFGPSTRALTRAALPSTPEFRDTNPIVKPEFPVAFTFQNTVPSSAKYARDYQNYQKGDVIYINTEYQTLSNPQNTENLTIYVDGDVTYSGQTNQGGNGTVFCVTEKSTLTLGAVSNNLIVYLAPGATLDIRKGMRENVTSWNPYQSEIVETGNNSFSFQNSHAAIYLSAGSKVKATDLTLISGAKLLNNGGSIEANNLTLDQQATLWNEGSIKVANTLTLTNTSSALYNKEGKTIETVNLDLINNDALLFNEGTVKATGDIVLHNTHAEIVNYGSLSGASFSSAAGGKMHNEGTGTVNITGKTDLTNSNSSWMNDGHWTCGSFDVDNYSHTNINNCYLTVNGQFHLNRGTFVLGANSGVVCNSFAWEDTSDFYLNSNSVLKVLGDLVTNNANSGYGFRGIGDEYAVIQAASIKHNGNEQFRMSYYGKLFIATDNHFEQWYKDAPNTQQPSYWYQSSVKFKFNGETTTTIPETNCNPGYEGDDDNTGTPTYRVIAEDLTANQGSDFDFNDVVFDVDPDEGGTGATITIRAAGGIWPLTLTVNGEEYEVHEKLIPDIQKTVKYTLDGVEYNCYPMINTHEDGEKWINTENEPTIRVTTGTWNTDDNIRNSINTEIVLKVFKYGDTDGTPLEANEGVPTCKILVDRSYSINSERNNISDGTKFKDYVQGKIGTRVWW